MLYSQLLHPKTASSIVLSYVDPSGVTRTLGVDCYIERGYYSGRITVDVADGALASVEDHIHPSLIRSVLAQLADIVDMVRRRGADRQGVVR